MMKIVVGLLLSFIQLTHGLDDNLYIRDHTATLINKLPQTVIFTSQYNDTAWFQLTMHVLAQSDPVYIEVTYNQNLKCSGMCQEMTPSARFTCGFNLHTEGQVQIHLTFPDSIKPWGHASLFVYAFLAVRNECPLRPIYSPYDPIKQNFPIMYKNERSMVLDIPSYKVAYLKIKVEPSDTICLFADPYIPYDQEVFVMYSSQHFLPSPTNYEHKSHVRGHVGQSVMLLEEGLHTVAIYGVNLTKTPVAGAYLITHDGELCINSAGSLLLVGLWIYLLIWNLI